MGVNQQAAVARTCKYADKKREQNTSITCSLTVNKQNEAQNIFVEKFVFPCKKWIGVSSKERDAEELECGSVDRDASSHTREYRERPAFGQVLVTELRSIRSKNPFPALIYMTQYEVFVKTGDARGAGTDANVFITLYGEDGDSGKRALKQKFRNLFERNQTDTFNIETLDLGTLYQLDVEHDNTGLGPGWLLEKVEVRNIRNKTLTLFPCNKWLDIAKGNGAIKRKLTPGNL